MINKQELLEYCNKFKTVFIEGFGDVEYGIKQFDSILDLIQNNWIKNYKDLSEIGMDYECQVSINTSLSINKLSFECCNCGSKTIVDAKNNFVPKEIWCPICGEKNIYYKYVGLVGNIK